MRTLPEAAELVHCSRGGQMCRLSMELAQWTPIFVTEQARALLGLLHGLNAV